MSKVIKIKKGLDIPLMGRASDKVDRSVSIRKFGICPDDFPGYRWKTAVKAGDSVKAGDPILYAKEDEQIKLVAPVSGVVEDVHRGERRKIEYVAVDGEPGVCKMNVPKASSFEDIVIALKNSGLFAMLRQRPFDQVPFMTGKPRDIFVTSFDSAPLAPEILTDRMRPYLEDGLKVLQFLTDGKVYLSVRKGSNISSDIAEVVEFEGPHPAGNVGVQIANINPVNKGEFVWTLDAETAARIGRFFKEGVLDFSTTVALTGPDVKDPHLVETTVGAYLGTLLKGQLKDSDNHLRIISGNVLTGVRQTEAYGWLRYPYRQITVIDEGDNADEFMGWASLDPHKFSVKRTFPTFLHGLGKGFNFDARIRGGHRGMIMNNEYDAVFPFDIYPEYLIKAILAKDIERMEQLGIYEVAPEDFALPEFVDTSKLELQKIVRDGLDYLKQETI